VVHYRNYEIACRASSNSLTAITRDSLDLFDKRGINWLVELAKSSHINVIWI